MSLVGNAIKTAGGTASGPLRHWSAPSPNGAGIRLARNSEPPNGNKVVVEERLGGLLRSYRRAA
jgi:hypothetical protein